MRILHFADLHIGVDSYGKIDPESGLSTRLSDILNLFDILVDYAIREQVDLVLFCGDTYKSRDPSQTQQREFARRIRRLSEAGIPVFLLVGNHDLPNAIGRATAIEIFDTLAVQNVYVGSRFDIYRVATRSGTVQIIALPWPRRNALLSREDTKGLTIDEINNRIEQVMTQRLIELSQQVDSSMPVIVAGHISVASAEQGSEKSMLIGKDPVILMSNMAQPVFDYVALGHIHRRQVLCEHPAVVYSGSLERLDFSDEKELKGFYVVSIENIGGEKVTKYEFVQVPARNFLTINVSLSAQDDEPTASIIREIDRYSSQLAGSVVRLQIEIPKSIENKIADAEINRALSGAYYVTIGRQIIDEGRQVLTAGGIEQLTPLEALKLYLEIKKVPEERRKILLEYGYNLIKEVSASEE